MLRLLTSANTRDGHQANQPAHAGIQQRIRRLTDRVESQGLAMRDTDSQPVNLAVRVRRAHGHPRVPHQGLRPTEARHRCHALTAARPRTQIPAAPVTTRPKTGMSLRSQDSDTALGPSTITSYTGTVLTTKEQSLETRTTILSSRNPDNRQSSRLRTCLTNLRSR